MYPEIHALIYGDSGVGKSTMAKTFPKPMLVHCWDGHGKEMPYRKGPDGKILADSGLQEWDISVGQGLVGLPFRDVMHPDGLVRIEYYNDPDPDFPTAFNLFRYRMQLFSGEQDNWKTVVEDSLTSMELSARKVEEKLLNPMKKFAKGTDTRQWFSGSTDALEEMVVMRLAGLSINVVVCSHINERKNEISGEILRGAFAPGRLATRGLMNSRFQEQYHLYTDRDPASGQRMHYCQTQNRDGWVACTQIDTSDPCYPAYLSLWSNYGKP